jgi:hypothetical protein
MSTCSQSVNHPSSQPPPVKYHCKDASPPTHAGYSHESCIIQVSPTEPALPSLPLSLCPSSRLVSSNSQNGKYTSPPHTSQSQSQSPSLSLSLKPHSPTTTLLSTLLVSINPPSRFPSIISFLVLCLHVSCLFPVLPSRSRRHHHHHHHHILTGLS